MTKSRITAVALGVVLSLTSFAVEAGTKKYSLADLKALLKSKSWSELVNHLEDVPPAQRKVEWKTVVVEAAKGYVQNQKVQKKPLAALVAADLFTKRYHWIKGRKDFMEVRAGVGIKGFKVCFRRRYRRCADRLLSFVETDKGNVKLAVEAAQLLARRKPKYFAIPLFELAVRWSKKRSKICLSDQLDLTMFAALNTPKRWKLVRPALAVATMCWKTVKTDLVNHFDVDGKAYKANTCSLLKKRKVLSRAQASSCP